MPAIFRSYFSKNNTLVSTNFSNNSQNPVTEIMYGGNFSTNSSGDTASLITRFIFDIDLTDLLAGIQNERYQKSNISKHILHLTNTIRYAQQYIGKDISSIRYPQPIIGNDAVSDYVKRSSGFRLEIFKITEDWSEGNKYDFLIGNSNIKENDQTSNWKNAKVDVAWDVTGAYSGSTQVIGYQDFSNGSENLDIDITDYINSIISGSTAYGLGIKYTDAIESGTTTNLNSVAFHTKYTNTYYDPYVETQFNSTIIDDRSNFYMDKSNNLILDLSQIAGDITINSVKIKDYKYNIINYISGTTVTKYEKGIYGINYTVFSNTYPDAVIFKDEWLVTINGIDNTIVNKFYLKSYSDYLTDAQQNIDNYYITVNGINENEKIKRGAFKKIKLKIKELYKSNKSNLSFEYGVFTQVGDEREIDIIPFTQVNKINTTFVIDLDTSWMIQQDYYLKIRQTAGDNTQIKNITKFEII